jgi:hypothetical protein
MRKFNKIILTLLLIVIILPVFGLNSKDSLRFEVLMSKALLNELKIDAEFIPSIEITSGRLILISSQNQFYLLGWGGLSPFAEKQLPRITSFAFTHDSVLMAIRNQELSVMDADGVIKTLYKLPSLEMGISRGSFSIYLYDRNPVKGKYSLYILSGGGKYTKLFTVSHPIQSVIEKGNGLLFTNRNGLFYFDFKTKEILALAALPDGEVIKSITLNPKNERIYFSTDSKVFTLDNEKILPVSNQLGGVLTYFNGLLVFNPQKQLLVRFTGLDETIAMSNGLQKTVKVKSRELTNESIVELIKLGVSENEIIRLINESFVLFDLSVDAMIALSGQNVPSSVIMAMKQAMKKQTSIKP